MGKRALKISTSALWTNLFRAPSVKTYFQNNDGDLGLPTFSEYISSLAVKDEVPSALLNERG
jgi:hypothetical protein